MALFKRSLLLIVDGERHYTLNFADTYRTTPFKYEVLISMKREEKRSVLKAPISLLGRSVKGFHVQKIPACQCGQERIYIYIYIYMLSCLH